jgi:hypothetical protein
MAAGKDIKHKAYQEKSFIVKIPCGREVKKLRSSFILSFVFNKLNLYKDGGQLWKEKNRLFYSPGRKSLCREA